MNEESTDITFDPKHLAFCEEFVRSWSAAKAYRKTHPDCSRATSWTEGPKYLRKPQVQELLKSLMEEKHMSADEALSQASKLARQGSIRALTLVMKANRQLIERIEGKIEHEMSWKEFIEGAHGDTDPSTNS